MKENINCPVCDTDAKVMRYSGGPVDLSCPRCGEFEVGNIAAHVLSTWPQQKKANLSGWIRENPGSQIFEPALRTLEHLRTPTVGEKAEKLLLAMARQHPKAGTRIPLFRGAIKKSTDVGSNVSLFTADVLPHAVAQAWAQDSEEGVFLIATYLVQNRKFLQDADGGYFTITPDGWSYIHSLIHALAPGNLGFVAMWFDKSMDEVNVAIQEAIQMAGYAPLRIDGKEHNNKIDDEIVAAIRRSKFVVADFTGHRGGVYFEAGFAAGLGIPVIWMCRDDELGKVHFDTRQYNHIVWRNDDLPTMKKSLQRRIEAAIGRGTGVTNDVATKT